MLTKISSHRQGKVAFIFDNGIRLSVIFDWGTYSDNYGLEPEQQKEQRVVESSTVEIWQTAGNPAFNRWIGRTFSDYGDDQPVGYVNVKHLPAILKRADSSVYKVNDLANISPEATT